MDFQVRRCRRLLTDLVSGMREGGGEMSSKYAIEGPFCKLRSCLSVGKFALLGSNHDW